MDKKKTAFIYFIKKRGDSTPNLFFFKKSKPTKKRVWLITLMILNLAYFHSSLAPFHNGFHCAECLPPCHFAPSR